jgi:hypothetical protein
VYEVLLKHPRVVSGGKLDLGEARGIEHRIDTGDTTPIRVPMRHLPFHKCETIRKEVDAMIDSDVIEPSYSPWSAPVVLVKKKDGTERFCMDYRKLNEVTRKDVYPLPRCEEILESLSGTAYFSHLDLVRGYWQIKVAKEDREKTAFATPEGLFQFKRLPFGLTNAPATFQRVMNNILSGLTWTDCLVYLDDIIVFGSTLAEHNKRLDEVLARLEQTGLKLNAKKCHLVQEKCVILGHLVSKEGISTDPEKTQVIRDWPIPNNISDLRSFLGCIGYYRQFIRDFAKIAEPLYKLERKGTVYNWNKESDVAFQTLKQKLISAPILAYPRLDLSFTLDTDACDTGIGAVLSQEQEDGERPIAFAARALTKAERNYSTTRKELLALVWGMEHFAPYLVGNMFTARTDHNALKWLNNFKEPKGQVARWIERLSIFNFTIEHRPGRKHGNADGVSRRPWEDELETQTGAPSVDENVTSVTTKEEESTGHWCHRWTKSDMKLYQYEDLHIGRVLKWVQEGRKPPEEEIKRFGPETGNLWSQFESLTLVDGLLYRKFEDEAGNVKYLQLCLPSKLVPDVLEISHNIPTSGHLGAQKMYEGIRRRFYWKGWQSDVMKHCKSCHKCEERNSQSKKPRAVLKSDPAGYPMEKIAMDIIGPLPTTGKGNRFILVVIDYFTRWPEAYAMPNQEAHTIAEKLIREWISRYGVMKQLHTDQGRSFENEVMRELTDMLRIKKTRTTPYHPQSDGMVERLNRTLKDMLAKTVNDRHDDWDVWISQVLLAYRTTTHMSTGFTPHYMMFGREARMPVDVIAPDPPGEKDLSRQQYVRESKERFQKSYEMARETTGKSTQRYKEYYDAKANGKPFEIGDRVWLHVPYVKKGKSLKLSRPWTGPYVVMKKLSDLVYRIQMENNKKKRVVVHFNRLKKCCSPKQQSEETKLEERTRISSAVPDVDADRNTSETADVGDPVQRDWIVVSYKKDSPLKERQNQVETSADSTREQQQDSRSSHVDRQETIQERPQRNRRKPDWFKF